jgi:sugar lactone lactonase YvrE
LYGLFWPVPIEPEAWSPPPMPPLMGAYAANDRLGSVERLGKGAGIGPEDIAFDAQGRLYGGMADGRILRFAGGDKPEVFATTGGRPAGLRFDAVGNLIVADTYAGLLSISPQGQVTVLATEHAGVPFRVTDDLDIASDGIIYFSDASSKFGLADLLLEFLECRPNGRLLAYDPATKSTRLLLDGLYFANGVALSPDESFVLVAETSRYRVTRYWLAGPKKGQSDVFIENLPGYPDGVLWNGRDVFWLALFSPRDARFDAMMPRPWLRRMILRLLPLAPLKPRHHAFVLGLDRGARVVHNFQDDSPGGYAPITNVVERDGWLYFGSTEQDSIGRWRLP